VKFFKRPVKVDTVMPPDPDFPYLNVYDALLQLPPRREDHARRLQTLFAEREVALVNVLIDQHHSDLLESLHRLFEDRLGMKVVVPHGLDWFEEGYWNFGRWAFGDDRLGRQFLLAPAIDPLQPDRVLRRRGLEEAKGMDFDLVIATVPDNYDGFRRFAAEKGAQFAIEVGNVNQPVDRCDLILDSTGQYPGGVPFTPEFDIEGAFAYTRLPATVQPKIMSFVNLFPGLPCYPLFEQIVTSDVARSYVYGHNGPAGFISPTSAIGTRMRRADFGWQDKISGDGFGYVIHYWASIGRPLIGHASHYAGQVAADLWEDGVTAIDLDKHSPAEAASLIEEIVSDPDRHAEMCFTIAQRVRERIDFAADAQRVGDALGLMVPA
jgi:hypothetical protein